MMKTLFLHPVAALSDNYIWLLHDGSRAWVVDPGEAEPVERELQAKGLALEGILVTHHHPDHTAGVARLRARHGARAFGPRHESIEALDHRLGDGDTLDALGLPWQVLEVPGHTRGHVAFFTPAASLEGGAAPLLFSGDTLFSGGCGRLFEGTAAQMLQSLERLSALPDDTLIACGHEYTVANLRFAHVVEPDNAAIQQALETAQQLRLADAPTLPTRLRAERAINPFLRSREASVRRAIAQWQGGTPGDDAAWFAALREWKNAF